MNFINAVQFKNNVINLLAITTQNRYYKKEQIDLIQEAVMNTFYFSDEQEKKYALACLEFAKRLGLIDDSSPDAVAFRCKTENEKRKEMLEKGETVYGLTEFSLPVYLDYELTRFKLDFVSEKEEIKKVYSYRPISKKEKKAFYKNNRDLFTRYAGDKFRFREVDMIIEKKMREEEYENAVNDILRQLP